MKNMHTGVRALRVKDFENIYYFTQKIYSRIFFCEDSTQTMYLYVTFLFYCQAYT